MNIKHIERWVKHLSYMLTWTNFFMNIYCHPEMIT